VRRAVVVALLVEALGFAAYGVDLGVATVRQPPAALGLPVGLLVLVALIVTALIGLARAVAHRRRGALVPVVVWHILSGLTAAQGVQGATVHAVAILQLLVSLVAGIGVLVPGVVSDADADADVGADADVSAGAATGVRDAVSDDGRAGSA